MYPEIVIAGKSRSGKSTLQDILVIEHKAVVIELADEIKRFVMDMFDLDKTVLWGAPEKREETFIWDRAVAQSWLDDEGGRFIKNLGLPTHAETDLRYTWFANLPDTLTARHALQTLGTDWGRRIDPNVWVRNAQAHSRAVLEGRGYMPCAGLVGPEKPPPFTVIGGGRFPNEVLATKAAGGLAVLIYDPLDEPTGAGDHASETSLAGVPDGWWDWKIANDKSCGFAGPREAARQLAGML